MPIFAVLISLIAQVEINIDVRGVEIPWLKTSEYIVKVISKDHNIICPDWEFPEKEKENIVVEQKNKDQSNGECLVHWYIDPLKAGIYFIPPALVKTNDGREFRTSGFILNVREPTQDEISNMKMIEDIFEPKIKNPWYYYLKLIALGGLIGIILIGVGYLLYRYLYSKPEAPIEVELPWEKALRRLRELKAKDLPSQGLYEPYYIQLSWILRYYIEDRFGIRAPELTTQEFIETALKNRDFPSEHQSSLIPFLKHCDRVKFAKLEPTLEQMEESFNVVWDFVEKTSRPVLGENLEGQKEANRGGIEKNG